MNPAPVNPDEQAKLLRWSRQTITSVVRGQPAIQIPRTELTPSLCAPHAAFVTLKKFGALRGCIGKMDFAKPLWENVLGSAIAAAVDDPRFAPVAPVELTELRLEISVLEPPEVIARPELFDAQQHGIIVEKGMRRALLLPKVAQEYGWDAAKTLEMVCLKAGLPADAWHAPDARLQIFTAFDFAEPNSA